MSNETKYCIQRKDLLESNQKVPVGTTYLTIDKPTEYKWLTEDDFFIKVNGEWHPAESIDFDFIESKHPKKGTVLADLTRSLGAVVRLEIADGEGGVEGHLSGIGVQNLPEGIKITGNGTLQHPMNVLMSPVYKNAPTMHEALVAIRAIQKEEWDNPILQKYGNIPALTTDIIAQIADEALKATE